MRVLFFTQKVDRNDDTLGVYHEWIRALAERVSALRVVCLFEGEHELPSNVEVYSLGKERGGTRSSYLRTFFSYLFRFRAEYDAVFVHMNKEYVVLGALVWKLLGKKIVFWYNHPLADWKARLAFFLADVVLYTSPFAAPAHLGKAVRMPVGVIVPEKLTLAPRNNVPRLISIARISKVKKLDVVLGAASQLEKRGVLFALDFYGAPVDRQEDRDYFMALKRRSSEIHRAVEFHGPVPSGDVGALFATADVSINLTAQGSMDKTIFESMAWGCPVVTSNPAVREVVQDLFSEPDEHSVADAVERFLALSHDEREAYRARQFEYVRTAHSVPVLVDALLGQLQ